jgi:SAM-dependent methyltransferase
MIANRIRYLWYLVVGASAIPAMRLSKEWWEDDYARESLARTEGEAELPRHLLVAGLARHYAPGGTILDIGCGTGGLTVPLRDAFAGTTLDYVGLDLSSIALEQAASRRDDDDATREQKRDVRFVQGDFDAYVPDRTFDAVIFSESLYYAADPLRTVRRYTSVLNPGGAIIVSMWRRPSRQRVWRVLRGELRERSRSRLAVPRRPAWDIVVFSAP